MNDKKEKYELLLRQLEALLSGQETTTGKLANASAAIHDAMGFFWVGFYLVKDGMLQLGPFQGPVACYRIQRGRGVCGTAWERGESIVVPDVEKFPGHIACSSLSRSEIVVPIHDAQAPHDIIGVLDIDSRHIATFDDTDRHYLEQACKIIATAIRKG